MAPKEVIFIGTGKLRESFYTNLAAEGASRENYKKKAWDRLNQELIND